MKRHGDHELDAVSVDVRELLERNVANLYSHLVTRPTGRAVRMAIERQLAELGGPALSLVDLSSVSVLDYSCADEVVAKLLLPPASRRERPDAFFVFRGLRSHHLGPIRTVLERHRLQAVVETAPERFDLLGPAPGREREVWIRVERERRVTAGEIPLLAPDPEGMRSLERLIRRRLLFRDPLRGDLYALSTLIRSPERA